MYRLLHFICLLFLSTGCGKKDQPLDFSFGQLHSRDCKLLIEGSADILDEERQILLSEQVFRDVLLNLDLVDKWNTETDEPFDTESGLAALRDSVKIEAIEGTGIFSIKATRPDRIEAAEIANEIAHAYQANRMLVLGKDSASRLAELEEKIAAQQATQQAIQARLDQLHSIPEPKLRSQQLENIAKAKLTLEQAETKFRFTRKVPFEEWPYYTNFNFGKEYATAIKDLMNANVTLQHLEESLGGDHPTILQAQSTRDRLREQLQPIADRIKREAQAAYITAREQLDNLTKPIQTHHIPVDKKAQYETIHSELREAQTVYNELVKQANAIGDKATESRITIRILEIATP